MMVCGEEGTDTHGQGKLNKGNGGRMLSQLDFCLGMVVALVPCHKFSFKNCISKWIWGFPLITCPGLQLLDCLTPSFANCLVALVPGNTYAPPILWHCEALLVCDLGSWSPPGASSWRVGLACPNRHCLPLSASLVLCPSTCSWELVLYHVLALPTRQPHVAGMNQKKGRGGRGVGGMAAAMEQGFISDYKGWVPCWTP